MIDFVIGAVLGWILTAFAYAHHTDSRVLDLDAEHRRRAVLLRSSMHALERYGEYRHLASAIRRELADEAGA